jgi:hypothetical protein
MHVLRLIQLTLVHKLRHFGVMTVNAWLALWRIWRLTFIYFSRNLTAYLYLYF